MKKIIILIPVYNDWDSVKKLILEISHQVSIIKEYLFKIIIVNDGSTLPKPNLNIPQKCYVPEGEPSPCRSDQTCSLTVSGYRCSKSMDDGGAIDMDGNFRSPARLKKEGKINSRHE